MSASPILQRLPLGNQWPCIDPFLFCAHHNGAYPGRDGALGLQAVELEDRPWAATSAARTAFPSTHGDHVPGFPGHPHRGFETVTLVREGLSTTPTRWARPRVLAAATWHPGDAPAPAS